MRGRTATGIVEGHHPPVVTDPRWARWSRPLLVFLVEAPRCWAEIDAWLAVQSACSVAIPHSNNCIAWLDQAGLIRSFYDRETGALKWVGVRSIRPVRPVKTDLGDERPSGVRRRE